MCYIIALSFFLISKCCKSSSTSKKFKKVAIIFAKEIALGILLLELINIVSSYAI